MNQRPTTRTLRQLAPAALVGLASAITLILVVFSFETGNQKARFHELAHQRIVTVRANIAVAVDSVNLIAGHFAVTPDGSTSRAGFKSLVGQLLATHKFVQGFSWNPRVRRADEPAFEARAHADGLGDFAFTERDADGKLVAVTERPEYVPVYYMEPMGDNMKALGFDLASNPVRKLALDTARDTGRAQATGRINLVQEKGNQYGVLILAPVFGPAGAGDIAQNRANLRGYVSGVFRLGDMLAASMAAPHDKTDEPHVDIHLFDLGAAPGERKLFPKDDGRGAVTLTRGLHLAEDFDVAGRRWQLVAVPSADFLADNKPVATLVTIFVALVALVLFLLVLKGRIDQVDRASAFARDIGRAKRRLSDAQRIARLAAMELDLDGNMHAPTDGLAHMLGLPEGTETATLDDILANVHDEDRDAVRDGLQMFGNAEGFDFRVALDGTTRTLHALVGTMNDNGHYSVTLQDITMRKTAEARTRLLEHELLQAQKLEAVGTLAGGIAHEINTPIQYIGDNLSFIGEATEQLRTVIERQKELVEAAGSDPRLGDLARACTEAYDACDLPFLEEELPNAIEQSSTGVQQVAGIVRAMKEFSHPVGKAKAPVDLNRIAERAALICKSEWKHVAALDFAFDPALPTVEANEGELNQVVLNLVVNAAHAIQEKDAGMGTIRIGTSATAEHVRLDVEDSGAGVPASIRDKIFEPFFTTKDVGKGTGQGLAICRDIVVNKHGGRLEFQSRPGAGTVFSLILPRQAGRPELAA